MSEPELPHIARRLANFAKAAARHLANGSPKCTEAQRKARFAICLQCEYYKHGKDACTHESCGCSVTELEEYLNKLSWADQECPIKKWLAEWPPSLPASI